MGGPPAAIAMAESPVPGVETGASLPGDCVSNLMSGLVKVDCRDETAAPEGCLERARPELPYFRFQFFKDGVAQLLVDNRLGGKPAPERPAGPLEIMYEDEPAMSLNANGRAEAVQALGHFTNATHQRVVMYDYNFYNPNFVKKGFGYDKLMRQGYNCGYKMDVVAACNNRLWTEKTYGQFIKDIIVKWKQRINSIAGCNEGNTPDIPGDFKNKGWLKPMLHMTPECTYMSLFTRMEQVITRQNNTLGLQIKSVFGEWSSQNEPGGFTRRVLKCPSDLTKGGKPLPMSAFSNHYYNLAGQTRSSTRVTKQPKVTAQTLSLYNGGIKVLYNEEGRLFKNGKIGTPYKVGKKILYYRPEVWWTEGGDMIHARGPMKYRNISAMNSARNTVDVAKLACELPYVKVVNLVYLMDSIPKRLWRQFKYWDTTKIKDGRLDEPLYVPRAFQNSSYAGCFGKSQG